MGFVAARAAPQRPTMRLSCVLLALCFAARLHAAQLPAGAPLPDGLYAEFVTPRGVITAELFYQKTPLTVASFVGLAEGSLGPKPGLAFFNGLKFHRVVPNFVVQGGDPLGTGEGGPGYAFPDELVPGLRHDAAGVLSMANDGPDTNGSQFFFTLREVNRLTYLHTVFGRVVRGLELLPLIKQDDVMSAVNVRRVGSAAQAFRADQATFAGLAARTKKYSAPAAPGPETFFDDPDKVLPVDPPRALAFQRKLANFERATGQRLFVRVVGIHPSSPAAEKTSNENTESLAGKISLKPSEILAVFFADTEQWTFWSGQSPVRRMTELEADILPAARTKAEQAIADFAKTAAPEKPITDAQKKKLQVDAVLDSLIFKLEPRS
ncbi:MAG: Peptidylprolyl isomerase [Verrucomicrobia bacterium]|nr:Peptidylprolyl isomerase [Verrucomicrobiota bacterium]